MSKVRSISFSSAFSSQNHGFCQSRAWRTGASRLPSRMTVSFLDKSVVSRTKKGTLAGPPYRGREGSGHRVEGLLEATGVALLGLGQGLEPVGDLGEAFLARGAGHARIHVGVLVRLARYRGLGVGGGWRRSEGRSPRGRSPRGTPDGRADGRSRLPRSNGTRRRRRCSLRRRP